MASRATRPSGRSAPGATPSGCTRMATLSRGLTRMYIAPLRSRLGLRAAEDVSHAAALLLNLGLEHHQGVDQLLRARRAAGDIDIDGDHLVDRNQGVVVEDAGGGGAGAHGDGPLGFGRSEEHTSELQSLRHL